MRTFQQLIDIYYAEPEISLLEMRQLLIDELSEADDTDIQIILEGWIATRRRRENEAQLAARRAARAAKKVNRQAIGGE